MRKQARIEVICACNGISDAVRRALPGDTIRLIGGEIQGPIVIDKPSITLEGVAGAVIRAPMYGYSVSIRGPHCAVTGLIFRRPVWWRRLLARFIGQTWLGHIVVEKGER